MYGIRQKRTGYHRVDRLYIKAGMARMLHNTLLKHKNILKTVHFQDF